MVNIRKCPSCSEGSHKIVFSFDYEYLVNVSKMDVRLLEIASFEKESKSNIVRCTNCQLSYIREDYELDKHFEKYNELYKSTLQENTDQGVKKTYLKKISGKEEVNNTITNLLFTFSKSKLHKPIPDKKIKILDFGCGWGGWLNEIKQYNFVEAYGYDINKYKIQKVSELGVKAYHDFDEIKKIAPFDIIICNDVIEHVNKPLEIIETLSSLTKSNGVLFAKFPRFSKKEVEKASYKMKQGKKLKLFHIGHINYFTPAIFKSVMKKNGFKPANGHTVSITWVNGPLRSNVIGILKFIFKVITFQFSSRYSNVWIKSRNY